MSNDWQWNSPDWRQPGEDGSLDNGLGNYPTSASSGSNGSAPDPSWDDPVSLPPPPPDPLPYSSYGPSGSSYGQSSGGSYPYGQPPEGNYPYGQPSGGSYPFAPSPAMRSRPRLWIIVPVLFFLVLCAGGIGVSVYAFHTFTSKSAVGTNGENPGSINGPAATVGTAGPVTIAVGAHPMIVIDRNSGAVQVQGVADSQQVVIKPLSTPPFNNGPIPYSRSGTGGNVITIDLTNFETVDVLLMVPSASDLNIMTNSDDITVGGIQGFLSLSSNAGSLHASNVTLTGKSTFDTNGGSITFNGSLDPKSVDHFSTNDGAITVTLPANAAFHVDITNNGGVIQSDFSQVVVSSDEAHGDVGRAPLAQVGIDSNGGTIHLNKGA